jgi:hypothetical protein
LDDRDIDADEFSTEFVDPEEYEALSAADKAKARNLADEAQTEDRKYGLVTREFMNHVILRQKLLHEKPVYRLVVEKFGSQINLTLPESLINKKIFQTTLRNIESAIRRELQTLDQTEKRKAAQKELIEENMKTFQEEQDVWNQMQRAKQMQWLSFRGLQPPASKPEKFETFTQAVVRKRAIDVIFKPVPQRPTSDGADAANLLPEQRALLETGFPFYNDVKYQLASLRILAAYVRVNPNGLPAIIQELKSMTEKAINQKFTGSETERRASVAMTLSDLGVAVDLTARSSSSTPDELRQFFETKIREKAKEKIISIFRILVDSPTDDALKTFYKTTGQRRGIFNNEEVTSLPIAVYLTKWTQYVMDVQQLPQRFDAVVTSENRETLLDYDNKRKLIQRLRAQIPTVYDSEGPLDLSWLETSALEDFNDPAKFGARDRTPDFNMARFNADIAYVDVIWNFITNSTRAFVAGQTNDGNAGALTATAAAQLNNIPTSSTLYLITRDVIEIHKQMKASRADSDLESLRSSIGFSPFIGRFDVFGNMKEVPPNIASLYGDIDAALQMNSLRTSLDPVVDPVETAETTKADSTATISSSSSSSFSRRKLPTTSPSLDMPSDSRALCQKWLFDFSSFIRDDNGRQKAFLSVASQYVHSLFMPSNVSLTELTRLSLRLAFYVTSSYIDHPDQSEIFDGRLSKMFAEFGMNLGKTVDISDNAMSFIQKLKSLEPCITMLMAFQRAIDNQYHVYEDIRIAIIYGLLLHEVVLSILNTFLSVVSESKLTTLAGLRETQRQLLMDMSTGKLFQERNELEKKLEHIINKESTLTDPTNTQVMFFIPLVKQVFSKAESWVQRNGPVLMNSPAVASWKWTSLVQNADAVNDSFTDLFVSIAAWVFNDVEFASSRRILTQVNEDKHHRVDDQQLRVECTMYSLKPGETIPKRIY